MRLYVLLVIILMKRMFPRHIWQVCSAPTPVLITAEITNIHFHLKCSNNESSFSSNLFIHFSSFSLSLWYRLLSSLLQWLLTLISLSSLSFTCHHCNYLTLSLSLSLSLSVHQPLPPSSVLFLWHKHILTYLSLPFLSNIWPFELVSYPENPLFWYGTGASKNKSDFVRFSNLLKIISVTYLIKHVNIKPKVYKIPGTYVFVWSFSF